MLLLALSASAQSAEVLSPAYQSAVRRYHSGDREGAIADMSAWPELRLRNDMRALDALCRKARACLQCPAAETWARISVRAALMLHSDCAQGARRDGQSPGLQESAAITVARLMKDDPSHRAFARRWYEAMASLAQAEAHGEEALTWAERGLRDFPDSVEMLLVRGTIEETWGVQAAYLETNEGLVDPNTRRSRAELLHRLEIREHLESAQRALRAALAVDASLPEPRLHLGRVAWRLDETAEARSALLDVLARKPYRATAFLAHLFLGRLDEDAGRLDDAAASYEAALALDPRSQSARLALSHVRLRRGDAAGARVEVERAVGEAGRRPHPDALWLYPWGPSVGVEDRLEALRREATS
ncbi:MAG TPA: tetratricopeptide repeat protein [Vicinamibacteria bacterium]|nr:tetratricopeptide repeat protein [Vicinamibacteria bacterium]